MNTKNFLGCLLIVMMGITACEGPEGPPGPKGNDGASTQWKIYDLTVSSDHWRPVHDDLMGNIFEYGFDIKELTGFVFDEGAVVCYLVQNFKVDGKNIVVQTPLPYTFYGEYQGVLYSENYTYEMKPGYINFIVKISDFDTELQQPLPCTFRVVLMW